MQGVYWVDLNHSGSTTAMANCYLRNSGNFRLLLVTGLLIFIAATGCSKQTDDYKTDLPEEYFALEPGKFIHYYLDSSRFIFFGQKDTVVHYQAKDVVDTQMTDNAGRQFWRIIRYLRPAESTDEAAWRENLVYQVTPEREGVEVQEGNIRQVKLKLPVVTGHQWRGNSFLAANTYDAIFPFNNDDDMNLWDFTYSETEGSEEINNRIYNNIVTVTHVADSVNVPITFPQGLALKNYWVEKYAKGIGLVYKEVSMWDYQPSTGGNPGYFTGFGIRMRIIDHN